MKTVNKKEIGKRIQVRRTEFGLTQEKLAEYIGVSPSFISEIERGNRICSINVLVNIADVLELNLDNLINGLNEKNADTTFSEILEGISPSNYQIYIDICRDIANHF